MATKQIWQMTLQERLDRLKKRVPQGVHMNNYVVESVHDIPFEEREAFQNQLQLVMHTLTLHYTWWLKVQEEINKPSWSKPKLRVLK